MKIFERSFDKRTVYSNRINFVDENNVVVGYDFSKNCCEDFGYFFTQDIDDLENVNKTKVDLRTCEVIKYESVEFDHSDYVFDPKFFKIGGVDKVKLTANRMHYISDLEYSEDLRLKYFYSKSENYNDVNACAFRLINSKTSDVIYLILYNYQNGYYHHGFELTWNNKPFIVGDI